MRTAANGVLEADRCVAPVEHGGPDLEELRRLGVDPAKLLDFSVCTNPFGPSPRVHEALCKVSVENYPDRDAYAMRSALAEAHGLRPEQMLAGNGVSELIWLAAMAFIKTNERVLVIGPTYGEYARAALLQGANVTTWSAREQDGFAVAVSDVEAQLQRRAPRAVFLCNPNNPTGTLLAPEVILSWVRAHQRTLFVVDEAYQRFAPGSTSVVSAQQPNLLVLRSMTKDYALAGLRVGYAVGSEEVIAALAGVQFPWSVSAFAQAAAVAALKDQGHLAHALMNLEQAKRTFVRGLIDLGLPVWPSACHFFLVRVGDGLAFRRRLLAHGILVRAAASFGLPAFVRLSTRRPEDNARLLAALEKMKQAEG